MAISWHVTIRVVIEQNFHAASPLAKSTFASCGLLTVGGLLSIGDFITSGAFTPLALFYKMQAVTLSLYFDEGVEVEVIVPQPDRENLCRIGVEALFELLCRFG